MLLTDGAPWYYPFRLNDKSVCGTRGRYPVLKRDRRESLDA